MTKKTFECTILLYHIVTNIKILCTTAVLTSLQLIIINYYYSYNYNYIEKYPFICISDCIYVIIIIVICNIVFYVKYNNYFGEL